MLQLVALSTELQAKNLTFGKKWVYRIAPPSVTLEAVDGSDFLRTGSGITVINALEEANWSTGTFFNSAQISFTNSLEDTRIANLEREVSQLREVIAELSRRSGCSD